MSHGEIATTWPRDREKPSKINKTSHSVPGVSVSSFLGHSHGRVCYTSVGRSLCSPLSRPFVCEREFLRL